MEKPIITPDGMIYTQDADKQGWTGQQFTQADVEAVTKIMEEAWEFAVSIVRKASDIAKWSAINRPKQIHLTVYAKTARRRKKNRKRLIREYEEAFA